MRHVRNMSSDTIEDIPTISPSEIKKTLKNKNISFEEGHACFQAPCPMCLKKTSSKIYINKTTGKLSTRL